MAKSGRWTISFPLVAVLMMALWALVAAPAFAATVAVANTNDAGVGSLRDAIAGAAAGDVLDLSGLSGSIVLSSGELVITKDLTITGPGAGSLSIDGDSTSRVFSIDSGNTLTISGLTITGGNGVGATQSGNGGAFFNSGTLTLSAMTLTGNNSSGGGPALTVTWVRST